MTYVKIGEVATLFGVEPQTIRVWVEEGELDCIRTPHGHRRFDLDYILGVLNNRS